MDNGFCFLGWMLQMVGESSVFIPDLTYPHIQFLMSTEKTCKVVKIYEINCSEGKLRSDEKDIPLFCNFLVTCSCSRVRMSICTMRVHHT